MIRPAIILALWYIAIAQVIYPAGWLQDWRSFTIGIAVGLTLIWRV